MGFMGSANVFFFPREDKSYSWIKACVPEKEVGLDGRKLSTKAIDRCKAATRGLRPFEM